MSSAVLNLHTEITWILPVFHCIDGIFIVGEVLLPKAGSVPLVMEDMSEVLLPVEHHWDYQVGVQEEEGP